jgi:hypothetical protein
MFLMAVSSPSRPNLPNKDHYQMILEETTVLSKAQLLAFLKDAKIEPLENDVELVITAVAYKNSQVVVRFSWA